MADFPGQSHMLMSDSDVSTRYARDAADLDETSDMDVETLVVMQSFLEMLEIEHDVVQGISAGTEVERDCSSETQQLSEFVHIEVERVCSLQTHIDRIDLTTSIDVDVASVTVFDFDILMIEAYTVMSGHMDPVLMDTREVTTVLESAIMQSFIIMFGCEHEVVVQDLSLTRHLEQHACSEVAQ